MADILPNQNNTQNNMPDKKKADISKIIFVSLVIIAVVLSCFITWGIITGNGNSLFSNQQSKLDGFSFLADQNIYQVQSTSSAGADIKFEVVRSE